MQWCVPETHHCPILLQQCVPETHHCPILLQQCVPETHHCPVLLQLSMPKICECHRLLRQCLPKTHHWHRLLQQCVPKISNSMSVRDGMVLSCSACAITSMWLVHFLSTGLMLPSWVMRGRRPCTTSSYRGNASTTHHQASFYTTHARY